MQQKYTQPAPPHGGERHRAQRHTRAHLYEHLGHHELLKPHDHAIFAAHADGGAAALHGLGCVLDLKDPPVRRVARRVQVVLQIATHVVLARCQRVRARTPPRSQARRHFKRGRAIPATRGGLPEHCSANRAARWQRAHHVHQSTPQPRVAPPFARARLQRLPVPPCRSSSWPERDRARTPHRQR